MSVLCLSRPTAPPVKTSGPSAVSSRRPPKRALTWPTTRNGKRPEPIELQGSREPSTGLHCQQERRGQGERLGKIHPPHALQCSSWCLGASCELSRSCAFSTPATMNTPSCGWLPCCVTLFPLRSWGASFMWLLRCRTCCVRMVASVNFDGCGFPTSRKTSANFTPNLSLGWRPVAKHRWLKMYRQGDALSFGRRVAIIVSAIQESTFSR